MINILMFIISFQVFPTYGGFKRQILFIKPDDQTSGYFIILDELTSEAQKHDITWLLHSRGTLNLSDDFQSVISTVPSYISNDNISLQVTFLEEISGISEAIGYFLPVHYNEPYPYDDLETSYIKASYSGSENPIMATILYPKNDSDTSQSFPNISADTSGLRKIGSTDYLFYNEKDVEVSFPTPNITFNGQLFFLRQNRSNSHLLDYYFLQNAQMLGFENTTYFSSSSPLHNLLVTYSNGSQISGALKAQSGISTTVTLYTPFSPKVVELDGVNSTFSSTSKTVSFSVTESISFVISASNETFSSEYDPLRDPTPVRQLPSVSEWDFNMTSIQNLTHSYILYSQDDLPNLRTKFHDPSKDWNSWYLSTITGVDSITNATDYDPEVRYNYVYKLALKYVIDGGNSYLTRLIEFLKAMGSVTHYSQDLRRAYAVQAYALAYDMVYENLTGLDRAEIANLLYNHAEPLLEMDLYPTNNHRIVDAGALGVAGLALKDKAMINKALETILNYYYTFNPVDGGSYEGYSYNAFAMDEFMNFAIGLKNLGGYNLFNDSQILATFDFMAETLGPLGMPSLYEDCTFSSRLQEVLLVAAANVNETYPAKAQNYQYIWEQRQNNSQYQALSATYYTYLNGGWAGFHRLMGYNVNETIKASYLQTRKEIWKDSGMAFLRSADRPDGLFLSFSCKDYGQSHVHFDENSFEIWAFGALIVNNPGYPGWGALYHDWTIGSEASNTLLIENSDQLRETANGLSDSISSPYFSMLVGNAEEIYTDLAVFNSAPELYLLLILNICLVSLAGIMFWYHAKYMKPSVALKSKDEAEHEISKGILLKMVFIHPYKLQDHLISADPHNKNVKFLNRAVYLIFAGMMVIFYLILVLDIISMVDYHMQYYEDSSQPLIDILNISKLFVLYVGPPLTFLCSFLAISVYSRLNRTQIRMALKNHQIEADTKKINAISATSIGWFIPILFFSFLLLYFTTANSFKDAIHNIFVGSGSTIFVYNQITMLLREFILNSFIIIMVSIPSLLICLKILGYGAFKSSLGSISRRNGSMISLISYFLLITMFFLLIALLFFGVKYVVSLVGVEGFV
ncbi:MAG: heparinase II/III domain-containing protein [Candidatus Helarchaeota archaeon]